MFLKAEQRRRVMHKHIGIEHKKLPVGGSIHEDVNKIGPMRSCRPYDGNR